MTSKLKLNETSKPLQPVILTDELAAQIDEAPKDEQALYLFLRETLEFRDCWQVDSPWSDFFFEFEPIIGPYRLVYPHSLEEFIYVCERLGYYPIFTEDPQHIFDRYEHLNDPPNVELYSNFENTEKGFLSWQVEGFNKLIRNEDIRSGYFVWTVGSGKTAMIAAAILYHQQHGHPFDMAMVVVKAHNKIDTQRKLKEFTGLEATILDGTINKRGDVYVDIYGRLLDGEQVIVITNYEKFRDDYEAMKLLFDKRNVLCFWDEAPRKLSNRETKLYRRVKLTLYRKFYSKSRVKWARHWILSATPIENSPDDVFSVVHLTWPGLLGTESDFQNEYVGSWNWFGEKKKPRTWRIDKLDRLGAQLGFMTHRVSRDDPRVRDRFPERIPQPQIIDWHPLHLDLYDQVRSKAIDLFDDDPDINILSMIQVMQMICDAPSMIAVSAENRERFHEMLLTGDDEGGGPMGSEIAFKLIEKLSPDQFIDVGHTKLDTWRQIITEKHPDEKIITHSTWAEYIFPIWEHWLTQWGISYVLYYGPHKQEALDQFRSDDSIQVLLSGDGGSDSLDIEGARIGVSYNIPWKWTTLEQRIGRRDRVSSNFPTIVTYDLMMANSIDERKLAVCETKQGYHEAVFDRGVKGIAATSYKLTREELYYVMTGSDLTERVE
jgi:SNF2 family DNA or RNA helicase